jgi:azurin
MSVVSRIFLIGALAMGLWSCGGGETQSTESSKPAAEQPSTPATVELTIEGNDMMKYNTDRLKAGVGQKVIVTLKHTGQMPKEAMGHNWVLLAQGTDMVAFATEAQAAVETEYIPAGSEGKIIAHTKLIGGGEETTIEFDAPAAGVYDFICSFPGHFNLMKGKFVVL